MHAISITNIRAGVLENWFFAEHEKEVTDKYDLFYYGGVERNDPLVLKSNTTQGVVCLLNDLKALLLNAYIDCAPLKKTLARSIHLSRSHLKAVRQKQCLAIAKVVRQFE